MRSIWLVMTVQFCIYMVAWLLASIYVRSNQASARYWGESSGCFAVGLAILVMFDSIRGNPWLYGLLVLFLTQGFLSISAAIAAFFNVAHWSRRHLLQVSTLVAVLSGLATNPGRLADLRMPLLLIFYGSIILSLLVRFRMAQLREFGFIGTWAMHGPTLLLSLGMIGYGFFGALSGKAMPTLSAESNVNFIFALALLVVAGLSNFTYLLRLCVRLVRNLRDLSRSDPLTELANRRAFDEAILAEHERFVRSGRSYALISADIDYFKAINDNYGHAAGDQVLLGVARQIAEHVRALDTAARVGGEEFLLLLSDSDIERARTTAERLRQRIAESHIAWHQCSISVTISLGVAQIEAPDDSVQALMQRVDEALYEAKNAGRNRVVARRRA